IRSGVALHSADVVIEHRMCCDALSKKEKSRTYTDLAQLQLSEKRGDPYALLVLSKAARDLAQILLDETITQQPDDPWPRLMRTQVLLRAAGIDCPSAVDDL